MLKKINKKVWFMEIGLIVILILLSLGKNKSIVFDESNTEIYGEAVMRTENDNSYYIVSSDIPADADLSQGYAMIGNKCMLIYPGAYEVQIEYQSSTNLESIQNDCSSVAGWLQIRSYENPSDVKYSTLELTDGSTVCRDRMWITSLAAIKDLDVKLFFNGTGYLQVKSITLTELPIWRVTRILAVILLLAFCDFCYIFFFAQNKYANKGIIAGLIVTSFVASLPSFNDFVVGGHDLPFHLSRILSLGKTLESGHIWSPIEYDMVNDYGYASPLFYGQLFLYIPALLYLFVLPIHICYQIYVVIVNTATCVIAYICFKKISNKPKLALFGSALYTLSAYRISNVYVRAAVGEYTAMTFLPLIVMGMWFVYTKEAEKLCWKEYFPIVLGLTGVLHSHTLSMEMAAVFILICCVVLWKRTLKRKRFVALCKALGLTLLLNLGYLSVFLDSMRMSTLVKTKDVGTLQESGSYLVQIFGMFMTPSGKSLEKLQGDMPINLGFTFLIGLLLFAWCYSKRIEWNIAKDTKLKAGTVTTLLAIIAIFFL